VYDSFPPLMWSLISKFGPSISKPCAKYTTHTLISGFLRILNIIVYYFISNVTSSPPSSMSQCSPTLVAPSHLNPQGPSQFTSIHGSIFKLSCLALSQTPASIPQPFFKYTVQNPSRSSKPAIKRPQTRSTAARQVSTAHERDLVTNQNV